MLDQAIVCRAATPGDADAIRHLQALALRRIGRAFYRADAIEAFLERATALDGQAIVDGHYFLAETSRGRVAVAGGWSQLLPRAAEAAGQPFVPAFATLRTLCVDPGLARRGLGGRMLATLEWDAMNHGIRHLGVTAPLSGAPFFAAHGYHATRRVEIEIGQHIFAQVTMERRIIAARAARAA